MSDVAIVPIAGSWDITKQFNEMGNKVHHAMRYGLYRVGQVLQRTASSGILHSGKTGKYYKYRGKTYRASSAGEYPANITGQNRKSIGFNVVGNTSMRFGARAKYSGFLVQGTRFMAKRDFLIHAHKIVNKSKRKYLEQN